MPTFTPPQAGLQCAMTHKAIDGQLGALSLPLPFLHGALCRLADQRGVTTLSDLQRHISIPVGELLRLGASELTVRDLCALADALRLPAHELLYLAVPEARGPVSPASSESPGAGESGTNVS